MRKRIFQIYAWVLSFILVYYLLFRFAGGGLPCFLYLKTGLLCPGCGASRMLMALLRGDFAAAWAFNPFVLCLFAFWNAVALFCFVGKPAFVSKSPFLYTALFSSAGAAILFGVLRNFL